VWSHTFTVEDPTVPIMANVIVQNGLLRGDFPDDPWFGTPWGWDPPIIVRLFYPGRTDYLWQAFCPFGPGGIGGQCKFGRQQVVGVDSLAHPRVPGTYRIEVEVANHIWYVQDGVGPAEAEFTVDLFHG
jgi:hypothetical protein